LRLSQPGQFVGFFLAANLYGKISLTQRDYFFSRVGVL
jgi:hypothetical protein